MLTAGATGSHHVVATAVHAARLGLEVEAVRFPQPTHRPRRGDGRARPRRSACTSIQAPSLHGDAVRARPALGRAGARRAPPSSPRAGPPPSASSGTWAPGLELADRFAARGLGRARRRRGGARQRRVLGGPGRSGLALGGLAARDGGGRAGRRPHRDQRAGAARDRGGRAVAARARGRGSRRRPAGRSTAAGSGPATGTPRRPGTAAAERAAGLGLASEPTYTAKALAAAFERLDAGRRVVFLQTLSA